METTIYIRKDRQKTGVGKKLYEALEKVLHAQNICNLYACIGYPEIEDKYLTKNSAQFHAHLGYRMVGEFYHCGYKFNRWYNMVWMEKLLDPEVKHPKADQMDGRESRGAGGSTFRLKMKHIEK